MYTEFYGLKEKPFNLTPSPRFLYLSKGHNEALAILNYGVMERMGFILLTGEVGTGKTTMVRALLENLNTSVQYVHLSNPLLSPEDFINYLGFSVFKKRIHFKSKAEFLLTFEQFLQRCVQAQKNFNLIIDEAHKLSFQLLEEIRLLSNMETGDEKLINIFLVGQSELNQKLSEPRCRPLLQRISIRYHIPPLNLVETRDYMATRLKIAGGNKLEQVFSKSAVEAIYNFSGGFPREINILADNALLLGYSTGIRKITPSMVKECYDDLRLPGVGRVEPAVEQVETLLDPAESEVDPIETGLEHVESLKINRAWKLAAALLFFLAFSVLVATPVGKEIIWRLNALITSTYQAEVAKIKETSSFQKNEEEREISNIPETNRTEIQKPPSHKIENHKAATANIQERTANATAEKKTEAAEVPEVPVGANKDRKVMEPAENKSLQSQEAEATVPEKERPANRTVIVGRGDTLTGLAVRIYGKTSDDIIAVVKAANPDLKNIHFITSGQKIVFPQLKEFRKNTTFTVHIASYKLYEAALNMYRDLLENGYEVYILLTNDPERGKIFRVTVGYFKSQKEAENYAATIVRQGISTYAKPIEVDMSEE